MDSPSAAAKPGGARPGGQRGRRSVRDDSTQLTLSEAMRTRDASRLRPEDEQQARELEPGPDAGHDDGGSAPSDS